MPQVFEQSLFLFVQDSEVRFVRLRRGLQQARLPLPHPQGGPGDDGGQEGELPLQDEARAEEKNPTNSLRLISVIFFPEHLQEIWRGLRQEGDIPVQDEEVERPGIFCKKMYTFLRLDDSGTPRCLSVLDHLFSIHQSLSTTTPENRKKVCQSARFSQTTKDIPPLPSLSPFPSDRSGSFQNSRCKKNRSSPTTTADAASAIGWWYYNQTYIFSYRKKVDTRSIWRIEFSYYTLTWHNLPCRIIVCSSPPK